MEWAQSRVEVKTVLCSELFVKRKKTTTQNESSFNRKRFRSNKGLRRGVKNCHLYLCITAKRTKGGHESTNRCNGCNIDVKDADEKKGSHSVDENPIAVVKRTSKIARKLMNKFSDDSYC